MSRSRSPARSAHRCPHAQLPPEVDHFAKIAAADLDRAARRAHGSGRAAPARRGARALPLDQSRAARAGRFHRAGRSGRDRTHRPRCAHLADDMHAGHIDTLIIVGANPVYDAPGELGLRRSASRRCRSRSISVLSRRDRGALHVASAADAIVLESWSDIRAFDGTASIVQPLIRPLYDTRTAHELLAFLGGADGRHRTISFAPTGARQAGTARFRRNGGGNRCKTASSPTAPPQKSQCRRRNCRKSRPRRDQHGFLLTLAPDPSVFDGSIANNAWLQECPKPFTKQVWGNALHSPTPTRAISGWSMAMLCG